MSTGRAIVCGTLLVGILDGLDAIVFFHFWAGVAPGRIFQGIAAGLLGRTAAVQGGTATVVLGVVLHFVVAFGIVTVFVAASRRLRVLAARPVVFGIVYGLAACAVMNFVVMPLSAIGPRTAPLPVPVLVNGLLIHVVGVGLPTAFIARAASRRARYDPIGSPA
jgi:uncharacterized membrane protein YagU involved in acid resistance